MRPALFFFWKGHGVDTMNKFGVALHVGTGNIAFLFGVPEKMTRQDALLLAAWIVAIADRNDEFSALLKEIQNT